jgi:hypothetical protein
MAAKSPKDREYASFFPLFPVWLVDFLKPKWDKAKYTNDIIRESLTTHKLLIGRNHFQ